MDVPLLCFLYEKPVDGYPIYHSWVKTLADITMAGFESWRETLEVRVAGGGSPTWGGDLGFGMLEVTKGLGRISILLWCVVHTYVKLKDSMTPEMQADFLRHWVAAHFSLGASTYGFGSLLGFCQINHVPRCSVFVLAGYK